MLGKLLGWIILGGIVGWLVSLIAGRDFQGGCLTYVIVGIVTMLVIGLLFAFIRILAILLIVALAIGFVLWLIGTLGGP